MRASRFLSLLVFLACAAAPTAFAWAHASLVSAQPADGSALPVPPAVLRLRFNEPVTPLVFKIVDPSGAARGDLDVSGHNETIEIKPPADSGEGTYTLSYRVISADGHPVGGTLSYSIGKPTGRAETAVADTPRAVLIWITRTIFYIAFLFSLGGALLRALSGAPNPSSRASAPLYGLPALALAAALFSIGLQGLDMRDAPLSALLDMSIWRAGAGSTLGAAMIVAAAASCPAAFSQARAGQGIARLSAAAALCLAGVAFTLSGHASAASPQWLTRPAVFLHVVCAALLLAPLPAIAGLSMASVEDLRPALRRLRKVMVVCLAALAASGLALAIIQARTPRALVETSYGWVLLLKLGLILSVAAVVLLNRLMSKPSDGRAPLSAAKTRRRFARLELALVCAILGATAGWRFTPPPRAIAPIARGLHIHAEKMMANISFSPGRAGANRVEIQVLNGEFGEMDVKEVTIILTPRNGLIEPKGLAATRAPDGAWGIDAINVPFAGAWHVSVEALVSDFDKIAIEDDFEFGR